MLRQPGQFVSQGSPMFAREPGRLGPRLRAVGARQPGDAVSRIKGGMTNGVLLMDAFGFGLGPAALQCAAR